MNAQPHLRTASNRMLWEQAAIESAVPARALLGAVDLARQEETRRAESILRQLAQAVAQPTFEDADAELTRFVGAVRRAHHLHSAAVVEAIVEWAAQLGVSQVWTLPKLERATLGAQPATARAPVELRR
ncbi:MAG: hypothetical protein ACRDL8_11920 [Solirubrobacteraceae bacterium]